MIRINLLPAEYEIAQSKKEQQLIIGAGGCILFGVLAIVWWLKSERASELEGKISGAQAQLQTYQAVVSQIERIEADKKALLSKRDVIQSLGRSRLVYPVFFEDLLPVIPPDVWLGNLSMVDQGPQLKVTMNSSASSNFAVATWLTNLQQSPHFSGVELSQISYAPNTDEATQTLSFTLTCMYQHKGKFPLSD